MILQSLWTSPRAPRLTEQLLGDLLIRLNSERDFVEQQAQGVLPQNTDATNRTGGNMDLGTIRAVPAAPHGGGES